MGKALKDRCEHPVGPPEVALAGRVWVAETHLSAASQVPEQESNDLALASPLRDPRRNRGSHPGLRRVQ